MNTHHGDTETRSSFELLSESFTDIIISVSVPPWRVFYLRRPGA
jgi:hypothetical protein